MTHTDFDARYKVEQSTAGAWHVSDTQERKIEAGPWRYKITAIQVLAFMRQHVGAVYRDFVTQIARMETATECDERTDGDGMSGDDAVDAISGLIVKARELVARNAD